MLSAEKPPERRPRGARDSSRKPAGDRRRRTSAGLIGFNALALAAFATPAFLMFAQAGPSFAGNPAWMGLSLVAIVAGCAGLFAAMLRLTRRGEIDLTFATLLIAGLALVAGPVAALVAVGPYG